MSQDDLQRETSEHLCHQIHTTQIRLNFSCLFQNMKHFQVTHNKKNYVHLFCLISLSIHRTLVPTLQLVYDDVYLIDRWKGSTCFDCSKAFLPR